MDAFKVGADPPHVKDVNEAIPGAHNQNGRGAHSARSQSVGLRTLHVKIMTKMILHSHVTACVSLFDIHAFKQTVSLMKIHKG